VSDDFGRALYVLSVFSVQLLHSFCRRRDANVMTGFFSCCLNCFQGVTNNASAVAVTAAIRSVSGNSVCADCTAMSE